MKIHAIRLLPGEDLKSALISLIQKKGIQAGAVLTCVGSLKNAALRLAGQDTHQHYKGKFEIVSLTGTLGLMGVHLHLAISDATGTTLGGHLVAGCEIYTTAEIVISEFSEYRFAREPDKQTGYKELKIYVKK